MTLRGSRGAARVARIGADPADRDSIVRAATAAVAAAVSLPDVRLEWRATSSASRPGARGRYLAGVVTLYPSALTDPYTLAWTVIHELGHAAGLDESGSERLAESILGERGA